MTIATSRVSLEEDIVRILSKRDPDAAQVDIPGTTTGAGDTSSVIDTALGRGTIRSGRFAGRMIKLTSGSAIGEVSVVTDTGLAAGGDCTVSPVYSAAPGSGVTYLMFPLGLTSDTVVDALARVLRATEGPHLWAPSLINDSDLDAADLTQWAAVATPSTREFVTAAATNIFGERTLHLIADAADEGATSNTLNVDPSESLLVAVHIQVNVGTCNVILRRITATAADLRTVAVTGEAFAEVRFTETPTSGTEQVALRFLSSAASDDFFISPHIIMQSDRRRTYLAPSWLISESQIIDLLRLPAGASAQDDDSFIPLGSVMRAQMGLGVLRSDRDLNPLRLEFRNRSGDPLYLRCMRPFAELSSDSGTTPCDRQYLTHKAVSLILRDRDDGEWRRWASSAAKRARTLRYGGRDLLSEQPMTTV